MKQTDFITPGKVFGNIYFVGTVPASTHIIDTGDGLIMLDPGMPEYMDTVLENMHTLGFSEKDIKILLMSHGHYDHAGAVADFLEICDAVTYVGKDDEKMVTGEENTSWSEYFGVEKMKPFTPDVLLCDGDVVELGNTKILCLTTPGHTDGTMSFFFETSDGKDTYLAGMHGGVGINTLRGDYMRKNGVDFANREKYFASIEKAKKQKVEIFLGNHVQNNKTVERLEKVRQGDDKAFYAPDGWICFLDGCKDRLLKEIAEEKAMEKTIDSSKLFNEIDRLKDEFVKLWVDFANAESPTEYKEGVDKASGLFVDYAKKVGFAVEILKQEKSGDAVCITMNEKAGAKPICLAGHCDTVHAVGSFGNPAATIDGDIMHGPGVMDCKGGLVAALMTMIALKNLGFDKRPIKLLIDSDEEVNSNISNKQTIDFMCEKAKGSVAVLNCESTRADTAVLYRKGVLRYRCDVTGKSIHASRCAEGGISAVLEASHKIIELEKMKDNDGLTCNCGLISGGTAANTVPDFCSFTAEIRFANEEQANTGTSKLMEICEKSFVDGTTCTTEVISTRPAMEDVNRNRDLLAKMNDIYKKCNLPILSARGSLGGSDAAEFTVLGVPCVDSIGVAGDFIHTPKEYARVSSLCEAAKRIATVCAYIED